MSRFAMTLLTCIIATVLGSGGAALMCTPAEAVTMSKADKVALKEAIFACKAEARGKKVKWLDRRKYVNHCVAEALNGRPNIDVIQLLKNHPDMKDLPIEKWDATWTNKPMPKAASIGGFIALIADHPTVIGWRLRVQFANLITVRR